MAPLLWPAAKAAAAAAALVLTALVEPPTRGANYTLARLGDDGTLTPLFDTGIPGDAPGLLSGVNAPCGATGTWWASPPEGAQGELYLIDVRGRRTSLVAVDAPAGCAGAWGLGAMAPSNVPGDAVAVMAPTDSRAWAAVVELSPAGGAPAVRWNLTAEAAGFAQIEPSYSAFDPASRTLYMLAAFDGALNVVALPLDAPPAPTAANFSVPFMALALAWAPAVGRVVAVGGFSSASMGLMALDPATGSWANLTVWGGGELYLSGLGQVAVDPTGRFVLPVFANASAFPTIPVVDAATGKEVRRITAGALPGTGGAAPSVLALGFMPVA